MEAPSRCLRVRPPPLLPSSRQSIVLRTACASDAFLFLIGQPLPPSFYRQFTRPIVSDAKGFLVVLLVLISPFWYFLRRTDALLPYWRCCGRGLDDDCLSIGSLTKNFFFFRGLVARRWIRFSVIPFGSNYLIQFRIFFSTMTTTVSLVANLQERNGGESAKTLHRRHLVGNQ